MKKLAAVAVVLLVLLIGAVLAVSIYIDAIARSAIERGSTYALGVETTLDAADVGITSGSFSMAGLNVANPEGFRTDHFLDLGEAGVQVSLGSLRGETVNLPILRFDSLDVNIERQGGATNVQAILDNLKRFESTDEPTRESKGGGKKFIIEEVDIRNVAIHVDALPVGGELSRINLPIERIQLKNVGSETKGGVLLSELAGIIVKAIMAAAVEKGGDLIPVDLLNDLKGQLAQLEDLSNVGAELLAGAQGQLEDITAAANALTGDLSAENLQRTADELSQSAEDLGKNAEKAVEDVKGTIGNLFGGDKDEEKKEGDKKKNKKKEQGTEESGG